MNKRIISGVLLLDKAGGISSHGALAKAKYLYMAADQNSKKAGHTGTLDPMATGLLPLCFGEATKFAQYGLDADKGYIATIRLGQQTDSGDADGMVVDIKPVPSFDTDKLAAVAARFTGEIMQVPPMYSALKKDGKKLYEYARAGFHVEREARPISIRSLTLSAIDQQTLALSVTCSKGTYVRVLGEDIAAALGTVGHLTSLRRTATGGFSIDDAITADALEKLPMADRLAELLPIDALMTHLPVFSVDKDESARLKMGQRLNVKERTHGLTFTLDSGADAAAGEGGFTNVPSCLVRLYCDDDFIGLGEISDTGRLQPKKLVA